MIIETSKSKIAYFELIKYNAIWWFNLLRQNLSRNDENIRASFNDSILSRFKYKIKLFTQTGIIS